MKKVLKPRGLVTLYIGRSESFLFAHGVEYLNDTNHRYFLVNLSPTTLQTKLETSANPDKRASWSILLLPWYMFFFFFKKTLLEILVLSKFLDGSQFQMYVKIIILLWKGFHLRIYPSASTF